MLLKFVFISLCVSFITAQGQEFAIPTEEFVPVLEEAMAPEPSTQVDLYQGDNGGYIICYCNCAQTGLYSVGNDIYVMGRVRLEGTYRQGDGVFEPTGYEGQDISANDCLKFMCNMAFTGCQKGCWAGGETGIPTATSPVEEAPSFPTEVFIPEEEPTYTTEVIPPTYEWWQIASEASSFDNVPALENP